MAVIEMGRRGVGNYRAPARPENKRIGNLLRLRRQGSGVGLADLGERVGLCFQQIQKYENGANRLSVEMLIKMASAIGFCPVEFVRELEGASDVPRKAGDHVATRIMQAVVKIENPRDRSLVLTLANALVASPDDGETP